MPRQPTFTTSIRTPWMLAGMACLGACTFVVLDAPAPAESLPAEEAAVEQVAASCVIAGFPAPHRVCLIDVIAVGDMGQAHFLLAQGTDPNTPNAWGETPLHAVSQRGRVKSVRHQSTLLRASTRALCTKPLRWLPFLLDLGASPRNRRTLEMLNISAVTRVMWIMASWTCLSACTWAIPDAPVQQKAGTTTSPVFVPTDPVLLTEMPLINAATARDMEQAKHLLAQGADPDARDYWESTTLHTAASIGHAPMVELLLAHGADPEARDYLNRTPLHAAAQSGSVQVIELLMLHGTDLNVLDKDGNTPLQQAVLHGQASAVKFLLDQGADPIDTVGNLRETSLLGTAVSAGYVDVARHLLPHGLDPNLGIWGIHPLQMAAMTRNEPMVELLISHGVDPDATDSLEFTPLQIALFGGEAGIVKRLCALGSSSLLCHQARSRDQLPLITAVKNNDASTVRELLIQGADPNSYGRWRTTPLHIAAATDNVLMVESLLAQGADPTIQDIWGETPLHAAAAAGTQQAVRILLTHDADPDARANGNRTPLHLASFAGHEQTAKLLLAHGANPNARDQGRNTPLHEAAAAGADAMVDLLLAAGADPLVQNRLAHTPLHDASTSQTAALLLAHGADPNTRNLVGTFDLAFMAPDPNSEDIAELLLAYGADPNVQPTNEWNVRKMLPLHMAASQGEARLVWLLLTHGADPNAQDADGATAMHHALTWGEAEPKLLEILLAYSADPRIRNQQGDTPLQNLLNSGEPHPNMQAVELLAAHGVTMEQPRSRWVPPLEVAILDQDKQEVEQLLAQGMDPNGHNGLGDTALHVAVREGDIRIVELLLGYGANTETGDLWNGDTPLHLAAAEGQRQIAEVLLHHGADPEARNIAHRTPLYSAAAEAEALLVELLLAHGADPNARDKAQDTPLHRALVPWHETATPVIRVLLAHNANHNVRNSQDWTPLHLAAFQGDTGAAELLLVHGADPNAQSHSGVALDPGGTPLHGAVARGDAVMVQLLLHHGADPNALTVWDVSPLFLAPTEEVVAILCAGGAQSFLCMP